MKIKYFLIIGLIAMLPACIDDVIIRLPQKTEIAPSNILTVVKVTDLRKEGVITSKREAAFGVPMGTIEFHPYEVRFIKQLLETELSKLLMDDGVHSTKYYFADLVEFGAYTDTTPLYWDVIGRIHIIMKDGENQYDLHGTHKIRTYIWPSKEIIEQVINESLSQIVNQLNKVVAIGTSVPVDKERVTSKINGDIGIRDRWSFRGFSIMAPAGNDWIILQKSRTGISLTRNEGVNKIHTTVASAEIKYISPPIDSITKLRKFVTETEMLGKSDQRFKDYHFYISTVRVNGKDCIKSDISAEDHGVPYASGKFYILEGFLTYCIHPDSNNNAILIGYSQRYEIGTKPLSLEKDGQQFVKSLSFESLDK